MCRFQWVAMPPKPCKSSFQQVALFMLVLWIDPWCVPDFGYLVVWFSCSLSIPPSSGYVSIPVYQDIYCRQIPSFTGSITPTFLAKTYLNPSFSAVQLPMLQCLLVELPNFCLDKSLILGCKTTVGLDQFPFFCWISPLSKCPWTSEFHARPLHIFSQCHFCSRRSHPYSLVKKCDHGIVGISWCFRVVVINGNIAT